MRSRAGDHSKNNFRTNIFYNNLENYNRYRWTDVFPDNSQIFTNMTIYNNNNLTRDKTLYDKLCTTHIMTYKNSPSVDKKYCEKSKCYNSLYNPIKN